MLLNTLRPPHGSRKKKTRLGRGESSGHGKTSGKGHKGQKSRSGGYHKVGFEGGQMPLLRRLPKRGFRNIFGKEFAVVNLSDLERVGDVSEVDVALLKAKKIVRAVLDGVKILGTGELKKALTVKAHAFSKSAVEKIEKAGGKAVVVGSEKKAEA